MIAIIDYGLGNVNAFSNIYSRLGIQSKLAKSVEDLEDAGRIILPGVGAFDWAMAKLDASGMLGRINELALEKKIPVLGVCVGMQIMAHTSEEGGAKGLSWFDANVKLLGAKQCIQLPHMGWNTVDTSNGGDLFRGLSSEARFYFLHSYFFCANDPGSVIGTTKYGDTFTCAIQKDNIFGVQFHPEKSHSWGVQLLKNFADL